jgi:hypothetical protein
MKMKVINLIVKMAFFALVMFLPIWTVCSDYYYSVVQSFSVVAIINGISNIYEETVMFVLILFVALCAMLILEFIAFDLKNKGKDYKVYKNFSLWIIVISSFFFLGAGIIAPTTYVKDTAVGYGYIHFILGVIVFILDRIEAKTNKL